MNPEVKFLLCFFLYVKSAILPWITCLIHFIRSKKSHVDIRYFTFFFLFIYRTCPVYCLFYIEKMSEEFQSSIQQLSNNVHNNMRILIDSIHNCYSPLVGSTVSNFLSTVFQVVWSKPKLAWAKQESIIHTLLISIIRIIQKVINIFLCFSKYFQAVFSELIENYLYILPIEFLRAIQV